MQITFICLLVYFLNNLTQHNVCNFSYLCSVAKEKEHHTIAADEQANAILQSYSLLYGSFIAGSKQSQQTDIEQGTAKASKTQQALMAPLVDLTNDEDDNNKSSVATEIQEFEDPESRVWHCIALDGERKGPYSLAFLKRLKDNSPCSSKFKVWKTGQNEENSITLNDAVTLLHQGCKR